MIRVDSKLPVWGACVIFLRTVLKQMLNAYAEASWDGVWMGRTLQLGGTPICHVFWALQLGDSVLEMFSAYWHTVAW